MTCINNIVYGCNPNLQCRFSEEQEGRGGLIDSVIAHNVFVNADGEYNIEVRANQGEHRNTLFANNIIVQKSDGTIALWDNARKFTFRNNLWWPDKPPSSLQHSTDLNVNPQFVSNVVNLDPSDADPGDIAAALFKLAAGSPCIDAGRTISDVDEDYWRTSRPRGSGHDIGAHERG